VPLNSNPNKQQTPSPQNLPKKSVIFNDRTLAFFFVTVTRRSIQTYKIAPRAILENLYLPRATDCGWIGDRDEIDGRFQGLWTGATETPSAPQNTPSVCWKIGWLIDCGGDSRELTYFFFFWLRQQRYRVLAPPCDSRGLFFLLLCWIHPPKAAAAEHMRASLKSLSDNSSPTQLIMNAASIDLCAPAPSLLLCTFVPYLCQLARDHTCGGS